MAKKAWTDYPLFEDEYGKEAPIREVNPQTYDGDKYVTVEYDGDIFSFKAGYLYSEPKRCGEAKLYPVKSLPETRNY